MDIDFSPQRLFTFVALRAQLTKDLLKKWANELGLVAGNTQNSCIAIDILGP